MTISGLLLLAALGACGERPAETTASAEAPPPPPPPVRVERGDAADADAPPHPDDADTPEVVQGAPQAPEGAAGIRPLLMAQHAEDLPGLDALTAHPDPEAALRWLVVWDDLMLVQARATDLLGLWDTDENAAFLIDRLSDEALHAKQRTAAALGLARLDLAARPDAVAALVQAAYGADARCAVEAIGVLAGVPSARAELETLQLRTDLDAQTAQALIDALE